jgi:holo-[acyl-carrier protein] synthase
MILGIGVDQVEVVRIQKLMTDRPEQAARRLFTMRERQKCESRQRRDECYAARFAAKEAFVKALGCGLREGMSWTDIEVRTEGTDNRASSCPGRPNRRFCRAAAERSS